MLPGTGNHMVTKIDEPKIDADEFIICSNCRTQVHIEDMVTIGAREICRWCFAKDEEGHEFTCNKKHNTFHAVGIPTECSRCHSWFIEHETSRVTRWIEEAQQERNLSTISP